jgi:hypothetical protein
MKIFSQNPDVRKKKYLVPLNYTRSVSDPEYILLHTISYLKTKGANRTSALEQWIETYRESVQETPTSNNEYTFQMQ